MCLFVYAVDTGVNEGEPVEEFAEQYREPELEDLCHEQEAAATDAYISEGKFHRPLRERLHPCEDI